MEPRVSPAEYAMPANRRPLSGQDRVIDARRCRIDWYGLYPFHGLIFGNLIRAIARRAEKCDAEKIVAALQA